MSQICRTGFTIVSLGLLALACPGAGRRQHRRVLDHRVVRGLHPGGDRCAQARNGEITGPWPTTASFSTPQPQVVIGTPTPTSPINNTTTATVRPTLTVTNGTVTYRFEVDEGTVRRWIYPRP